MHCGFLPKRHVFRRMFGQRRKQLMFRRANGFERIISAILFL
jgi:hypothetical protein